MLLTKPIDPVALGEDAQVPQDRPRLLR
jgi:hypothetical protein